MDRMYDTAPSDVLIRLRTKWRRRLKAVEEAGDELLTVLLRAQIHRANTTLKSRGIGEEVEDEQNGAGS